MKELEENDQDISEKEKLDRIRARTKANETFKRKILEDNSNQRKETDKIGSHWSEKELKDMTDRDWRIFREDFDIRIQGGRATFPLRYWSEANFPPEIMKGIEDAKYEKPSPIQRQAIPIGNLQYIF